MCVCVCHGLLRGSRQRQVAAAARLVAPVDLLSGGGLSSLVCVFLLLSPPCLYLQRPSLSVIIPSCRQLLGGKLLERPCECQRGRWPRTPSNCDLPRCRETLFHDTKARHLRTLSPPLPPFCMMPVFRKDPCGFICLLMTYGAVLYADYVVVRWIILQTMSDSLWGSFHVLVFNTIVFLLFLAHGRAVFSDPGIVPLPQHRIDFSDSHSGAGSITAPREDWTICTR